jgi:hypothetical protein
MHSSGAGTASGSGGSGNAAGRGSGGTSGSGPSTGPFAFPLKVSSNHRYLVDANDQPFLVNQVSSWALIQALSTSEANTYLDTLKSHGYDSVLVSIVSSDQRDHGNPPNWVGDGSGEVPPFTTAGNFSTMNPAYFAHADAVIAAAAQRQMLVVLVPSYLGYDYIQGLNDEMSADTVAHMTTYGQYLGDHYKNVTNVIWCLGGDRRPPTGDPLEDRLKAVADGIKAKDRSDRLWTAHWVGEPLSGGPYGSYSQIDASPTFAGYFQVNGYYSYNSGRPSYVDNLNAYAYTPTMPAFNLDQSYRTTPAWNWPQGEAYELRRKAHWAMLNGGFGSSFDSGQQFMFGPDVYTEMETDSFYEQQQWWNFWSALPWWKLVPSGQSTSFVTQPGSNFGVNGDYIISALADDKSFGIAYTVDGGAISIALSSFASAGPNVRARFWDPTNGAFTSVSGSPLAASGTHAFTPAGQNAAGGTDWLLLLESVN